MVKLIEHRVLYTERLILAEEALRTIEPECEVREKLHKELEKEYTELIIRTDRLENWASLWGAN